MRTPCRTCGRLIRVEDAPAPSEPSPGEPVPLPPWYPFCSERCKMADLGRWFSDDYRVAGRPADPRDES